MNVQELYASNRVILFRFGTSSVFRENESRARRRSVEHEMQHEIETLTHMSATSPSLQLLGSPGVDQVLEQVQPLEPACV